MITIEQNINDTKINQSNNMNPNRDFHFYLFLHLSKLNTVSGISLRIRKLE